MKRVILTSLISFAALTSAIFIDTNSAQAYDPIGNNLRLQEKTNREVYELENMQYSPNNSNGRSYVPRLVIFALSGIFGAIAYGNKK